MSLRQPRLGVLDSVHLSGIGRSYGGVGGIQDPKDRTGNGIFGPEPTEPREPAPHPRRSQNCTQKETERVLPSVGRLAG